MKAWFCIFTLACATVFAGSVKLVNDSQYKLRAIIRAADGSYLGETIINAGSFSAWTDSYGPAGQYKHDSRSQTPYTVMWSCIDGGSFSTSSGVPTGGMSTALGGDGPRTCKSPPKSPGVQAPETYLPPPPEQVPGGSKPQNPYE